MFFLSRLAAAAAIANAMTGYLGYLDPRLGSGAGRVAAMAVAIGGLAALNLVGVRPGSWAVNLLTVAKLVPLLLFVGVGLLFIEAGRVRLARAIARSGLAPPGHAAAGLRVRWLRERFRADRGEP